MTAFIRNKRKMISEGERDVQALEHITSIKKKVNGFYLEHNKCNEQKKKEWDSRKFVFVHDKCAKIKRKPPMRVVSMEAHRKSWNVQCCWVVGGWKRVPRWCSLLLFICSYAFPWMMHKEVTKKNPTYNWHPPTVDFCTVKAYAFNWAGFFSLSLAFTSSFFGSFWARVYFKRLLIFYRFFPVKFVWRSVFGFGFFFHFFVSLLQSVLSVQQNKHAGDKYASHTFVCIVQFDDIAPQMPTCTICNSSFIE